MTRRTSLSLLLGGATALVVLAVACDFPEPALVPDDAAVSGETGTTPGTDGATSEGGADEGGADAGPDAIDPGIADASGEKPPVAVDCDLCDCDEDGYVTYDAAVCPDASGRARLDCDDLDERANPDAGFIDDPPTADTKGNWNCDDKREGEVTNVNLNCADYTGAVLGTGGCNVQGFVGTPACGVEDSYVTCGHAGPGAPCTAKQNEFRKQGCR